MIDPGASTEELIEAVRERLRVMERCAQTRRNRQQGTDALTDLFLCIEGLGRRLGLIEWDESVSAGDEDEDDLSLEPRREMSLHELMGTHAEEEEEEDEEAELQLEHFRRIIRFTCRGCTSAEMVTKKWLALIRRVDPDSLQDIGMGQIDVARALGERRATTSKREQREFEGPMKASGARGWRNAGGARTKTNRNNCAKAQRGNRNRTKNQESRKAEPGEAA